MHTYNKGDDVIISKNLENSLTKDRFTIANNMYKMQGKVYKIESVSSNSSVLIHPNEFGRDYRFDMSDITLADSLDSSKLFLKEKKKHIFDPELLHL